MLVCGLLASSPAFATDYGKGVLPSPKGTTDPESVVPPAPIGAGGSQDAIGTARGSKPADDAPNLTPSPSAPTQPSVVAPLAFSIDQDTKSTIQKTADANDGKQASTLTDAAAIAELAANRDATLGALFCAEGANVALTDPQLSASDLAACRSRFQNADGQAAQYKNTLKSDSGILGTDGAQGTLSEFEQNYGVSGEDYLQRMLKDHGREGSLAEMMGTRLSSAQVEAALSAEPPPGGDNKFEVSFGGSKVSGSSPSPRNKLLTKLADAGPRTREPSSTAARPPEKKSKGPFGQLEPATPGEFFEASAAASETREITIFDVVHRKYLDVTDARGLNAYRHR